MVQKKIPVDKQLLTLAREESNLEKEMMEHMKNKVKISTKIYVACKCH